MAHLSQGYNAFDPKPSGRPEDVIKTDGPVTVFRGGATIRDSDTRFAELGQRTLRIKSHDSSRAGKFVVVTREQLEQHSAANGGRWLANVGSITETALNATSANRQPAASPAARPVVRNRVSPPPVPGAPVARRPVPPPPQPQVVYDEPPGNSEPAGPDPVGLLEDRLSGVEHGLEKIARIMESKFAAQESGEPHEDFPWCDGNYAPLPPGHAVRLVTPSITHDLRFHTFAPIPLGVVIGIDVRDTSCARSFPTPGGPPFQLQWSDDEGQLVAMNVEHVGLQFSVGPMDMVVLLRLDEEDQTNGHEDFGAGAANPIPPLAPLPEESGSDGP